MCFRAIALPPSAARQRSVPHGSLLYHAVSQLVYATGRDKVSDVWVAGRHLLKERRLTTLDEAAIRQSARQWREKIAESNGLER